MNLFAHIGFTKESEISSIFQNKISDVIPVDTNKGTYLIFSDSSGAELYLQQSPQKEMLGSNPHFKGKSRLKVAVTKKIEREESPMDGAILGWANPKAENAESGLFPFVFDVPDFYSPQQFHKFQPQTEIIQLTGFPLERLEVFNSESEFMDSQSGKLKFNCSAFIPTGLFTSGKNHQYEPKAIISGIINNCELLTNSQTEQSFYHFVLESSGGELDIVCSSAMLPTSPVKGNILSGSFWLSGRKLH